MRYRLIMLKQGKPPIPIKDFTVTAHTGAMRTAPNSTESIGAAIETGADIAEMDVTFRNDGTPVIIHSGKPGDGEGVLFAEALREVNKSDTLRLNLDLKAFWNTADVQKALIDAALLDRAFYTGVSAERVKEVKSGSPLVPYYINASIKKHERENAYALHALAEKILDLGGVGLNIQYTQVGKTAVDIMHGHGLLVSVWTVRRKADMKRLLNLGVDNITTKNPKKLRALL